jgi:hypothetical protein
MEVFLAEIKNAARARSWHWKLVCCGSRNQAHDAFTHARAAGDMGVVVLLVDAEGPVNGPTRAHLRTRDGWDLRAVDDDLVHLMVQTMEAWIAADPDRLARYYGQRFNRNVLPQAINLEAVAKDRVANALARATHRTQKGAYHKIRHAGDLLRRIDPQRVCQRCPSCHRMFAQLGARIVAA